MLNHHYNGKTPYVSETGRLGECVSVTDSRYCVRTSGTHTHTQALTGTMKIHRKNGILTAISCLPCHRSYGWTIREYPRICCYYL